MWNLTALRSGSGFTNMDSCSNCHVIFRYLRNLTSTVLVWRIVFCIWPYPCLFLRVTASVTCLKNSDSMRAHWDSTIPIIHVIDNYTLTSSRLFTELCATIHLRKLKFIYLSHCLWMDVSVITVIIITIIIRLNGMIECWNFFLLLVIRKTVWLTLLITAYSQLDRMLDDDALLLRINENKYSTL